MLHIPNIYAAHKILANEHQLLLCADVPHFPAYICIVTSLYQQERKLMIQSILSECKFCKDLKCVILLIYFRWKGWGEYKAFSCSKCQCSSMRLFAHPAINTWCQFTQFSFQLFSNCLILALVEIDCQTNPDRNITS